jgi:hypothetical protein
VDVDRGDGAGFVRPKFPADLPQVERTQQWIPLARKYGAIHGVPPAWILGTIVIESGGDDLADNIASGGCKSKGVSTGCVGLMAIHWAVHGQTKSDMLDAEKNIDYGTSLLARSAAKGYDYPQAASIHVAGGGTTMTPHSGNCPECRRHGFCPWGMCEHKGYIERGVKAVNVFTDILGDRPPLPGNGLPPVPLKTAGVGGTLLVFGAGAVVGYYAIEFLSGGLRRMKF